VVTPRIWTVTGFSASLVVKNRPTAETTRFCVKLKVCASGSTGRRVCRHHQTQSQAGTRITRCSTMVWMRVMTTGSCTWMTASAP